MSIDPWKDPDPQPGAFDAELAKLDPRHVEDAPGCPDAKLIVLVGVEGEDAKRLQRISAARGKTAAAVLGSSSAKGRKIRPRCWPCTGTMQIAPPGWRCTIALPRCAV